MNESRLRNDYELMCQLREQSTFIEFTATGDPPYEYHVTFRCKGLVGPNKPAYKHLTHIYLQDTYPEYPPQVSFLSTIFHPNVAAAAQIPEIQARIMSVLSEAQTEAEREQLLKHIMHDDQLFKGNICLDVLDLDWGANITLDRVVEELGHLIQYKLYNVNSPMNREAAEWATQYEHLLPVDRRPLRDAESLDIDIVLVESIDSLDSEPMEDQTG